MSNNHGRFIWHELITSDPDAAKRFYGSVVGWTAKDMPMPGMTYTLLSAGGQDVAGLMPIPPDAAERDAPPSWTSYICVDDCDGDARRIESLGGEVIRKPDDIPGVGRFAVVADPGGAVFCIMTPLPADPPREKAAPGALGHAGWHELYAEEPRREWGFYEILFDWTQSRAIEMGEHGVYQLFANPDGDVGGMMRKPEQMPRAAWMYYFNVDAIDAATERVKAGGGQIMNGPMEVPGPMWVVQAVDPQGAWFALVAPTR